MSTPRRPRPPPQHHPRLLELLAAPTPLAELSYLIGASLVDLLPIAVSSPSPSNASESSSPSCPSLPPIEQYIWEVARRVHRPTGLLLVVLVYINRLKKIIPRSATGNLHCTLHRVFFGTFALASKTLNGKLLLFLSWNVDLAKVSLIFDLPSIHRIERELLSLFGYKIGIGPEELTTQALIFLHVYPDVLLQRPKRDDEPELPLPPSKRRKTAARPPQDTSSPFVSPISLRRGVCSAWSDSSDESSNSPEPVHPPSPSPPTPTDSLSLDQATAPQSADISGLSDLDIFHTPRSTSFSPTPFLTPPPHLTASPSSSESPLRTPPSSPPPLSTSSRFSDEESYEKEEASPSRWVAGKGTIFAQVGKPNRGGTLKRKWQDDE
ncbi:hypothetical protein BCR35DRAFT_329558 [Leucosporidium creatinivorum]|uniref:Cyclin N-terminal domain-containing protein n=1 Tax=Leucosporidium creatinivorum TaxID=106004 RepID=A0A1Y2FYG1_9BASI|nr:hypothetical protein BCR35DRAFT_329558 [Leucosporidium creatinivorum]